MIRISKIEVQKNHKDRVSIFVDDEYYASMYLDTAVKYGIEKDKEIDEDQFKKLLLESDQNLAVSKAVKYLDTALKTTKQIREYLIKKGYDKIVIDHVIEKLKEYKFIDDQAFAEAYVRTYQNKYGKVMLKNKLFEKGVPKNIIEEILFEYESQEEIIDNLLSKKIGTQKLTPELLTKCTRFLAGRGFSFDEINSAIKRRKLSNKGENYESWD